MEQEFVNYNQALKLKALGFDKPCFGYYDLDGLQVNTHHWYPENKNSSFPLPHTTNNPKISAPTFSQAFRWFREKYGIHSSPKKYDETQWWIEWGTWTSPVFETFEEAERAWLDKLIEIVESKSE